MQVFVVFGLGRSESLFRKDNSTCRAGGLPFSQQRGLWVGTFVPRGYIFKGTARPYQISYPEASALCWWQHCLPGEKRRISPQVHRWHQQRRKMVPGFRGQLCECGWRGVCGICKGKSRHCRGSAYQDLCWCFSPGLLQTSACGGRHLLPAEFFDLAIRISFDFIFRSGVLDDNKKYWGLGSDNWQLTLYTVYCIIRLHSTRLWRLCRFHDLIFVCG